MHGEQYSLSAPGREWSWQLEQGVEEFWGLFQKLKCREKVILQNSCMKNADQIENCEDLNI